MGASSMRARHGSKRVVLLVRLEELVFRTELGKNV